MNVEHLEMGTAIGLVGLGVFQIHHMYTQHAGKLEDMRAGPPDSAGLKAKLMDADFLTGSNALLVGGAIALATQKGWPLIIAALGFLVVSAYYHATLNSPYRPTVEMESNGDDDG